VRNPALKVRADLYIRRTTEKIQFFVYSTRGPYALSRLPYRTLTSGLLRMADDFIALSKTVDALLLQLTDCNSQTRRRLLAKMRLVLKKLDRLVEEHPHRTATSVHVVRNDFL